MVQLRRRRLVVMKDVPTMPSKEELAKDMVLKLRDFREEIELHVDIVLVQFWSKAWTS